MVVIGFVEEPLGEDARGVGAKKSDSTSEGLWGYLDTYVVCVMPLLYMYVCWGGTLAPSKAETFQRLSKF